MDRCVRAAAAIDRDVRHLAAADFRIGPAGAAEFARMVERRRLGPGPAQQRDVLGGAAIAGLVVGPVAVFRLVGVAAARNDVHRQPAAAELVEGRQLARGDWRRNKTRPVRQQKSQPVGHCRGVRADQKPVGRIGEIADQHAVKAGALMDARRLGDDAGIEGRPGRRDDLRRHPRRDPADHLHGHGGVLPSRPGLKTGRARLAEVADLGPDARNRLARRLGHQAAVVGDRRQPEPHLDHARRVGRNAAMDAGIDAALVARRQQLFVHAELLRALRCRVAASCRARMQGRSGRHRSRRCRARRGWRRDSRTASAVSIIGMHEDFVIGGLLVGAGDAVDGRRGSARCCACPWAGSERRRQARGLLAVVDHRADDAVGAGVERLADDAPARSTAPAPAAPGPVHRLEARAPWTGSPAPRAACRRSRCPSRHWAMTSAEKPVGIASQPLTAALPACQRSFSLFSAIPRIPLISGVRPGAAATMVETGRPVRPISCYAPPGAHSRRPISPAAPPRAHIRHRPCIHSSGCARHRDRRRRSRPAPRRPFRNRR